MPVTVSPTRAGVPALLLAAALMLSGCSAIGRSEAAPSTDGPLRTGTESVSVCLPVAPDGALTFGVDILRLTGDASATIEEVALVMADGIEVLGADVMPLSGTNYIGSMEDYPPSAGQLSKQGLTQDWAARRPAKGARLSASDGTSNIVLGVRATQPTGTAEATRVIYRSGGERYTVQTATALTLKQKPAAC